MRQFLKAAAFSLVLLAGPALAEPVVDGEIVQVDKVAGEVTVDHGAIANLDMPPMTMVFKVAEPDMLKTLKAGDKIKFQADRVNGAFTITEMKPAK